MRVRLLLFLLALCLTGCWYGETTDDSKDDTTATRREPAADSGISVPARDFRAYDRTAVERQRLDPAWREFAERDLRERLGTAATATPPPAGVQPGAQPPLTSDFQAETIPMPQTGPDVPPSARAGSPGTAESFDRISPDSLRAAPGLPVPREGGGPGALRVQVLLDRARFSPGVIDGHWGKNTEKAVYWFQYAQGLPPTGEVDRATWDALVRAAGGESPVRQISVTREHVEGPYVTVPEDVYQQAKLDCLCYESALERIAEQGHATAELIEQLNPQVDFANLAAGTALWILDVPDLLSDLPRGPAPAGSGAQAASPGSPAAGAAVARLLISKKGFYLQALDAQGKILYHFPSTLGSDYDPSPEGSYKVTRVHFQPDFHYQPVLFHEVPDDEPTAHLPPGPNSPVGLVWMALSKPHYGIHGTTVPETIGYTSSHGCVRLTNWDAVFLAGRIRPGVPVAFRD